MRTIKTYNRNLIRHFWIVVFLFLLMGPLTVNGVENTIIDASLQSNLDKMVGNVQQSKEIIGFDMMKADFNGVYYENPITLGNCNELLNAIQNRQIRLPQSVARSNEGSYEKYYDKIFAIIQQYSSTARKRLKEKDNSVENDEVRPLVEKDLYKEFSLLSFAQDKNVSDEVPYSITRALYQSSIDENNNPRYLEITFSSLAEDHEIKRISVNTLSMDGRLGHSLTTDRSYMLSAKKQWSYYGLFKLKNKVYIWIMDENPEVFIRYELSNSIRRLGSDLEGERLIDYMENKQWSYNLFITSPIGSDDQAHCQFYLKKE